MSEGHDRKNVRRGCRVRKVSQLSRPSEGHFARSTGRVTWLGAGPTSGRTRRRHPRFPHWEDGSTCRGKALRRGRAARAVLQRLQKSKLARQRKDRTPVSLDCSVRVDHPDQNVHDS